MRNDTITLPIDQVKELAELLDRMCDDVRSVLHLVPKWKYNEIFHGSISAQSKATDLLFAISKLRSEVPA